MRTLIAAIALACLSLASACTPSATPPGPVVEAGTQVATDVCSLIEGVDSNGTVRTICATIEEIAQIAVFILTLRTADAGPPEPCAPLPGSTVCATSAERAKGVLFVTRVRSARVTLDGGAQ